MTVLRILNPREKDNDSLVREHLPAFKQQKYRTTGEDGD
jgi:hypothetical protein